jgi:hypothetical protein
MIWVFIFVVLLFYAGRLMMWFDNAMKGEWFREW